MALGITVETDAPDDVATAVEEGSKQGIREAVQAGFAKSQSEVPVATGTLKQSGEMQNTPNGATFGYDADHAQPVEGGTEPHWPPIEPLKEWAAVVLGDPGAAYAVQAKIAAEGTDPQPFMQLGFQVAARELQRRGLSNNITGQL